MNTQSPRLVLIDASALKLSSCEERFDLVVIQGYRSAINANDIEFGSAFHACVKEYILNGGDEIMALKAALDYFKNAKMFVKPNKEYLDKHYLTATCNNWFRYRAGRSDKTLIDTNGRPIAERRFYRPFWKTPTTEVVLVGTMDEIARHPQNLAVYITDQKTTSVWNRKEYFSGYLLSCQVIFYARELSKLIEESKEGDPLFPFKGKDPQVKIEGTFHQASKPAEFECSAPFRITKQKLAVFEAMLEEQVDRLVWRLDKGLPPKPTGMLNDSCSSKFWPCQFMEVCKAGNEQTRNNILEADFVKKMYDPSKFGTLEV